jgi:hypothetical protein
MQNTITPDNVLNDEENRHLSQVIAVKKHIYSYINQSELIQFLLKVIDESGIVSFERQSDRRFVNLKNISLSLQLDLKKASKLYPDRQLVTSTGSRNTAMSQRAELLRETVVVPFTTMVNTLLQTVLHESVDEDFEHIDWLLRILPEDFASLAQSINNFADVANNKERIEKDFYFLLSMTSAFVFPPEEIDIDEDTGFTLEFLL